MERETIGWLLRSAAERFPDRPALTAGGQTRTYAVLDGLADLTARRLLACGVRGGERVALRCGTDETAIVLLYALARIGAAVVLPEPTQDWERTGGLLKRAEVTRLIVGDVPEEPDALYPRPRYPEETPFSRGVIYTGQSACVSTAYLPFDAPGAPMVSAAELQRAEGAVSPDAPAFLCCSGAAERCSAIRTSHADSVDAAETLAGLLNAAEDDRFCLALPLSDPLSLAGNLLAACACGACLYLPSSFRTGALLETVETGRCTVLNGTAAVYRGLLERADLPHWDLSSLRTGLLAAGPDTSALLQRCRRALGLSLRLYSGWEAGERTAI